MNNTEELTSICKNSLSIHVNENRSYHEDVKEYIMNKCASNEDDFHKEIKDIGTDIYNKIIELNNVVVITAYPRNSVGCYTIYHYDINKAINIMIEICKYDTRKQS
ncbi:MAG: hypothetical protein GY756_26980 [bacterium]|nr:hypothetical protein [bacterium]